MDSGTINFVCENNIILHHYYAGILSWRDLDKTPTRLSKIGDFIWINYLDSHWIIAQKMGDARIALFDSFGQKYLPPLQILKSHFKNLMNNKPLIITEIIPSHFSVQLVKNLTCGEHCLFFILYSCSNIIKHGVFVEGYFKNIVESCKNLKISPDQFVWNMIYKENFFHISKPSIFDVFQWYIQF